MILKIHAINKICLIFQVDAASLRKSLKIFSDYVAIVGACI